MRNRTVRIAATLMSVGLTAAPALALAGCSTDGEHQNSASRSGSPAPATTGATPYAGATAAASTGGGAGPLASAPGVDTSAWTGVDSAARAAGGRVAVLAAIVTPSGSVQVVHRAGPDDLRPIASVSKLYVMVAVLDAVGDGSLRWDSPLTVRREDISAGSGSLAGRGAGATLTVLEAVRLMFQQSDNTATSALIRTVGQPAMARALRETGHSAPDRMTPFLTIREDLWLLYATSAATARDRWLAASPAERTQLIAPARTATGAPEGSAHWRSGLGYVADTDDIARAWAAIAARMRTTGSARVAAAMTVPSPGFVRPAGWRSAWFKSGALDTVHAGTWFSPAPGGGTGQVVVVLATDGPGDQAVAGIGASAAARLDRYTSASAGKP